MKSLVSIIIPAYNAERYIENCIRSLLGQTYENTEIIVIDDGSVDKTGAICRKYQGERLLYLKTNNRGVSAARNTGLKLASGQYVIFADADDWAESTLAEKAVGFFREYDCDILCFNFWYEYAGKQVKRKPVSPALQERDRDTVGQLQYNILCYHYNELKNGVFVGSMREVWNKAYRRDLILESGIQFNEKLGMFEDALFNLELLDYAGKVVLTNEYLYHYRAVEDSACAKFKENRREINQRIFAEINRYLTERHRGEEEFRRMYGVYIMETIAVTMNDSIFHGNNGMCAAEKLEALRRLVESEPYKSALAGLDESLLTKKQRLLARLAKRGNYPGMAVWQQAKNGMKKLKGVFPNP